jgi:pimeloyl-ACP methyl ester carboxylesterase
MPVFSRLIVIVLGASFGLLSVAPPSVAGSSESKTVAADAGDAISFTSADGVLLHGQLFSPESDAAAPRRGGIVFVHGPNRSRRDWAYMAQKMSRQGFTTLTFDLRGHGASLLRGDEELDREIFMDADYAAMAQDVTAAVTYLKQQPGVAELGLQLAGSDLGGSLALLHAVAEPSVRTVTLLSPGLGYDSINAIGQAAKLGDRHLMMVFSLEDSYSKKSTEVLAKERSGPTHVEILVGVGHGTKMLSRDPALEVLLSRWFLGRIFAQDGRAAGQVGRPDSVDKSAPTYDIEAEKKRRVEALEGAKKSSIQAVDEDDSEAERKRWDDAK